jgi:hypothetical protein
VPEVPIGAVFDPCFRTAAGELRAGTAFSFASPRFPTPLLVTCQHLFGPAGGLTRDVPPELMPRFVSGVDAADSFGGPLRVTAGPPLCVPGVDAEAPLHDVAAFPLATHPGVRPLEAAAPPAHESPVYLAGRLRRGPPPGLFPARVAGWAADGTLAVLFDDPSIHLPGQSGAPVIDEAGRLVGMVVRFKETAVLVAFLVPVAALVAQLDAAPVPSPTPWWRRLFAERPHRP